MMPKIKFGIYASIMVHEKPNLQIIRLLLI